MSFDYAAAYAGIAADARRHEAEALAAAEDCEDPARAESLRSSARSFAWCAEHWDQRIAEHEAAAEAAASTPERRRRTSCEVCGYPVDEQGICYDPEMRAMYDKPEDLGAA